MNTDQKVIDLDIPLAAADVIRMMGYGRDKPVLPEVRDLVDRLVGEARELIQPRGVYAVREVTRMREKQLDLRGCPPICGQIAGFLKPAGRIAVFVVTIGSRVEELSRQQMHTSAALEGFVLDALGSAAADAAVDAMADHLLFNDAGPDEMITPPFSPGYCGLPLEAQQTLFSIVDAGVIGVRLLPSMIMQPIKSVSGLLGIGDRDKVDEYGVPCRWCELESCKMRRT